MNKEQLTNVIKELYRLWHLYNIDKTAEDIDFILTQVMQEIRKEEKQNEQTYHPGT